MGQDKAVAVLFYIRESSMRRKLLTITVAVGTFMLLAVVLATVPVISHHTNGILSPTIVYAQSCDTKDRMSETAESFIGRCCKGSIRSVFPSEYLGSTLSQIKDICGGSNRNCDDDDEPSASSIKKAKTAWKLLNRSEYRK
jgi:hypothetical protein